MIAIRRLFCSNSFYQGSNKARRRDHIYYICVLEKKEVKDCKNGLVARTTEVVNLGHHRGACVRTLARYTGKAVPPTVFTGEVGGRSVYIKDTQAREEYGLTDQDLEGIPFKSLRNAYEYEEEISPVRHERRLYPRALVVKRSLSKHKTRLNMRKQIMKYQSGRENEEEDDITDAMKNLLRILNSESKSIKGGARSSWHANQDHKRTQLSSSLKGISLSYCMVPAKPSDFLDPCHTSIIPCFIYSRTPIYRDARGKGFCPVNRGARYIGVKYRQFPISGEVYPPGKSGAR
eukprot:sb/3467653/